ncbi:ATPase RavA stimulator ViaA [Vibrio sp. S11_S32]|uniref:ATPase RavA stimulator ViaA n=1 Tax=Vibrio sp. S11_S32 TaxID=2720225 RepID=UPI001681B9DA|nr:ATPase RavA stimulator ViaA [Vibrio sp. S11_S32]MBD1576641.1 ATPase RavA stimulator ViaA [Vibrio sp. S11_S32]
MLGIDALDIATILADAEVIESALHDLMARSQLMPLIEENKNVATLVRNQLDKWKKKVSKTVINVAPSQNLQTELALYQQVIRWQETEFVERSDDLLLQLEPISSFYPKAQRLLSESNAKINPMLPHYFCHQWYQNILGEVKQAQQAALEQEKADQLEDLYQRIDTLQNMDKVDPDINNDSVAGRLWDMSSATLSKADWSVMKEQADFLKKHPKLQDIAQSLGRMAKESLDPEQPKQYAQQIIYQEEVSQHATDDIVGIHESDDLNKLLPNETLFLAYPELEVVFYKHLIDKRLMNYKMQGKARKVRKVAAQQPLPSKADEDTGPFIICVDASGSMAGFPEQCVKAIAFALMQIALAEERDCFVVLFSTDYVTYELTRPDGLREASDFLSYTFHGGTDLAPAITAALTQMEGARYNNADLVILSDFIAPKQSKEIIAHVDALKRNKNRFHAISLSKYANPELMNIFDHHWAYVPTVGQRFVKQK